MQDPLDPHVVDGLAAAPIGIHEFEMPLACHQRRAFVVLVVLCEFQQLLSAVCRLEVALQPLS